MNESDWEQIEFQKNRPHFSNEPGFEAKRQQGFEQIIREKDLKPGDRVHLRLLRINGKITSIDASEDLPVTVEREDGQTFSYSPEEVDPIVS